MTFRSLVASTLLLAGSLVFAQTCPAGTVCLVPSQYQASTSTTYMTPNMVTSAAVVPYTGTSMMTMVPMNSMVCTVPMTTGMTSMYPTTMGVTGMYPTTMGMTSMYPMGTTTVSTDTAVLANQIAALRADVQSLQATVRATNLQMRAQDLASRMNQLMTDEQTFRQQLAANPNLPNAQLTANNLSMRAAAINNDLNSFYRELSLIPVNQRPGIATELSAYTAATWDPTLQRFSQYSTDFTTQAATAYQPAVAANPWLTDWQTSYRASLTGVQTTQTAFAPNNWLSGSRVAGMMETYPGGGTVTLPPGAVIYIPAGTIMTTSGVTTTTTVPTTTPVNP